jgi:Ni,Fe-hydrogenase III component G
VSAPVGLLERLQALQGGVRAEPLTDRVVLHAPAPEIPRLAVMLASEYRYEFASLVVEHSGAETFVARYYFYAGDVLEAPGAASLIEMIVETDRPELPAISDRVHAADWHEREAEDMFGIHIAGHPFLGDFVLHDNDWREAVAPMRRSFDATQRITGTGMGVAGIVGVSGWAGLGRLSRGRPVAARNHRRVDQAGAFTTLLQIPGRREDRGRPVADAGIIAGRTL